MSATAQLWSQALEAASDRIVVVGNPSQPVMWNHRGSIADAIAKAQPNGTVIIPSSYAGTDCNPISTCNPGSVSVVDWRGGGTIAGTAGQVTVQGNQIGLANPLTTPGPVVVPGTSTIALTCQPVALGPAGVDQISCWNDGTRDWPMFSDGTTNDAYTIPIAKTQSNGYQAGQVLSWDPTGAGGLGWFAPGVINASAGLNTPGVLDATTYPGADPCVRIRNACAAAASGTIASGQTIDARGFGNPTTLALLGSTWPNAKCSVNPFPSTCQSSVLLPCLIFHTQATWVVPLRMDVTGCGWDQNPPIGFGATTLQACKSTDSTNCYSTQFPAAPGGPLLCWGYQNPDSCDRGGNNPIFDSPVRRLTIDCNGIAGVIGVMDQTAEEGSGLDTVKIQNCLNGGRALVIAGGVSPAANSISGISGTTVTGTGFTSDLLYNQVQFSAQAGTNYTIASINAAGTSITLDQTYTGAACAPCTMSISNAATQNGFMHNLYIVNKNTMTATTGGIQILMNTGSGSNEGPKSIDMVTVVNSNATLPNDMIRVSGCCTSLRDIHTESYGQYGIDIGADSVTAGISVWNPWTTVASSGTANVNINNAYASKGISIDMGKMVTPGPTYNIQDQINGNNCTDGLVTRYSIDNAGNAVYECSTGTFAHGIQIAGDVVHSYDATQTLTADSSSITATTAATATAVFTWTGNLIANSSRTIHCSGTTTQATAGAGIGISVKANGTAPTNMELHGWVATSATASAYSSSGNITSTTATAVYTGSTGTVTTQLPWTIDGSIEVGATAPTSLVIGFFTANASDAVVVKRDSKCTLQ